MKLLSPAASGRSTSVVYKDIQDGFYTPIPSFLNVFAVLVLDLDRSPVLMITVLLRHSSDMGIPNLNPAKKNWD